MQSSYKAHALLALITATTLAPFVNKAFYVDDPLFIWMAQQIARHPLDPYGFHLNWSSFTQPMSAIMQNPPLCSYYIAAIGSIFGWKSPFTSPSSSGRQCRFWEPSLSLNAFADWRGELRRARRRRRAVLEINMQTPRLSRPRFSLCSLQFFLSLRPPSCATS